MTRTIDCSIVIVNFRTYAFLSRCLASIAEENWRDYTYEVIVVDNASQEKELNKINGKHALLLPQKNNLGFAQANNTAIKKAKGRYVLLMNPDTEVNKNTISTLLSFMDSNREADIATCAVRLPDGNLDDACHRGFPTPWNALCHFSGISSLFPNSSLFNGYHLGYKNMDTVHDIDSCVGAFMLIRKSSGDAIGWLDEDYFWYGEDIDFCYRIKSRGGRVVFVPHVSILHYKGVSSGIKKHSRKLTTADMETRRLATKARFDVMRIFYRKHYRGKYHFFLTWLVEKSVDIGQWIAIRRLS